MGTASRTACVLAFRQSIGSYWDPIGRAGGGDKASIDEHLPLLDRQRVPALPVVPNHLPLAISGRARCRAEHRANAADRNRDLLRLWLLILILAIGERFKQRVGWHDSAVGAGLTCQSDEHAEMPRFQVERLAMEKRLPHMLVDLESIRWSLCRKSRVGQAQRDRLK